MGAAESKPQQATLGEAHAARRKSSATDQSNNQPSNQAINQLGMIAVSSGVTVYDRTPEIRHQSIIQSMNQPNNQSDQSHAHGPNDVFQSINHPINQVDQSINQPVVIQQSAPVNQPINQ